MKKIFLTAAAVLAMALTGSVAAEGPMKVIYHINEGLDQASNGLRNANNQLQVDPNAKIVFVAHSKGVDFLMKGAKDKRGNKYEDIVERLKIKGVEFQVCEITLKNRNLKKEQFILGPTFTPSGVVRIANLQARDHYVYIKP